jgi:hypothetical protein
MKIPEFNRNIASRQGTTVTPSTGGKYNRGADTKHETGISAPVTIGLYTIDSAILTYLQTKIRPVVTHDNKQIQVPVIYGSPERWKSVQVDGAIRDKNGKILLPIMMLRRTGMKKNSIYSPVNKYHRYVFKTGWNSRNIYDKFAALNGITPSETYHSSMVPDHYEMTYDVMIWTEYMEQMNKLIENVSFESDEYWGEDNNYKFISRIDSYEQITDLPTNQDRIVRSKFSINVRAYILPDSALDKNGNRAITTKLTYSPKKVVFASESLVSG